MSDTPNLALPYIEGGQAQKHVTHNEALRILDAAIQIAVLDVTRTTPPAAPAEGERHVVAAGASGAWAGRSQSIATWQDGAWAFLSPHAGWCLWSVVNDVMMVFDGGTWRDLRSLALDNVAHLGVNATADGTNRLSVKSSAALLAAIPAAEGGSGDVRLQLSKESAARTASVVFADNFSGRAEFGLTGSDAFRLKVSADGSAWTDALAIDQTTGNASLPRGLALTGTLAPPQLTANQNDYAPAGLASAAVLQISADAARSVSGLGGGSDGRLLLLVNVGSQPVTLLDDSAASTAANRLALGGALTLAALQSAVLRYDGAAARWQVIAGGLALRADAGQALSAAQQAQARANAGVPGANLLINGDFRINQRGYVSAATLGAGAYGHDRWKAGAAGGSYAFTQLKSSTSVTIAAGKTLIQVIEDVEVAGGSYVLSWAGSCLARAGVNSATPSGSFAVSPIAITGQSAGTVMSVEFGNGAAAGTLGAAKLEAGTAATPFAMTSYQDELAKARRYFQRFGGEALADVLLQGVAASAGDAISTTLTLTPPMRATPSVSRTGAFANNNVGSVNFFPSRASVGWQLNAAAAGVVQCYGNAGAIDCSAEM